MSLFAQNKMIVRKEFEKILSLQSKIIEDCEKEIEASQIKNFGKVLPKISGECEWTNIGCPISLVKPAYPVSAKKYGFKGNVKVLIFIDEEGKVVYAEAVKGKKIFYNNAEKAAMLSLYSPKIVCGKKVMQKKFIDYNFLP